MLIAFQGELGAYSYLACKTVYPNAEVLPCLTFEQAFAAVETGKADLAMIPLENSTAGRVAGSHSLMPHTTLNIIAEHFQPVHHCLMAPHGATINTIKEVFSHEQALAQCKSNIKAAGLTAVKWIDTAGAAQMVAKQNDNTKAAIASKLAAETYGLKILQEDFEDKSGNTTRFVILSKDKVWAPPTESCIISFIFVVRNVPAALYKALGGFATNGVNMVKLESYMDEGFMNTHFFAEVVGHPNDHLTKLALKELEFFSDELKILGVYPAARTR